MHFQNGWQSRSEKLQQEFMTDKRDLWMWLSMSSSLFYETLLQIQLIIWVLTMLCLVSSIPSCLPARRRDPIPCPPSPAASQHLHGRQSTARRWFSPVGPIRGTRGYWNPWGKRLLFLRLQDLPAWCHPHGHSLLLCQGERLQWGANWCSCCNSR